MPENEALFMSAGEDGIFDRLVVGNRKRALQRDAVARFGRTRAPEVAGQSCGSENA